MTTPSFERNAPGDAAQERDDAGPVEGHAVPGVEVVDLPELTALVEREAAGTTENRAARSLFQTPGLGSVLTALRAGASLHNDHPDEPTLVQGIAGECVISLDGHGAVIGPGTLVGIPRGVVWRILARTDAIVLLTVASA